MSDISALEAGLRRQLRGKTLLGEVTFEERHCDGAARVFRETFERHGLAAGLRSIRAQCPITFALWLVNEAFYCYDGGYWPTVLQKAGITLQPASARLGATFLQILEDFQLPRFRRLNTHWSYVGPILAHSGIPRAFLPQFFREVLPEAVQIGVASRDGFAELQQRLLGMHVSQSIEWFIRFGDEVSADFVRRCAYMYQAAQAGGDLPVAAFGVPDRVWREFEQWNRTAQVRSPTASMPRVARPRLYVDPAQGLRLELPGQPCHHASLDWEIRVDAATPIVRTVPRFAGEGHSEPDDVLLGAPFASVMVRLKEPGERELGAWGLVGLPPDRPLMFFDCEDCSVLPGEVSAAAQGVLAPSGYSVRVRRGDALDSPEVLSRLGRLPFGWGAFEASICDFTGGSAVVLTDEAGRTCGEIELREGEAAAPTLIGETATHLASSDRARLFVGSAPTVLIPVSRQAFNEQWAVVIDPANEHCNGALPRIGPESASLFSEPSVREVNKVAVPLDQPHLLGHDPWGIFDVVIKGPLGQGARFRIAIVPPVRIEHNWSDWQQGTAIRATVRTHAEVATATAIVPDRMLLVDRERTPLRLKCDGYGRQRWSIPVDLHLPIPSWSVQDAGASAHLVTWSSQPNRLMLAETDGNSPHLIVKTATPWGVPTAATLQLRHNERELFSSSVPLDANGYGKLDLQPLLANARQAGYSRVHARLDLQLARTVSLDCLTIERHWTVDTVRVVTEGGWLRVTWTERFPMHGRVLHVHSRLTPWEPARSVHVDASARGLWEGRISEAVTEAGRYRFELGVEDEWTGTFTSAGSCEWDYGTPAEWRSTSLYGQPSVDGALYHYLVNAADGTADSNALYIGTDERGEELSTKLFLALKTLDNDCTGVPKRLERLLSRVWIWPLLRGLVASVTSIDPRTLLEVGVLAQARAGAERRGLSEHQADQLWRLWPPLGVWADLHAMTAGVDRAAEARIERWMGTDALRQLGPVAKGSRLCFHIGDRTLLRRGVLLEVKQDGAVSPFDYHALRGSLTLRVLFEGENTAREIEVIDGVWIDAPDRAFKVDVDYPRAPSACCAYPESMIVELVKRGLGHVLKGQEAHCKPFPTSPVGQEAFQAAGFEWAIAAAEQPSRRDALVAVSHEVTGLARTVPASHEDSRQDASFERLAAELKARAHPLGEEDPLLAVHQASWLVASTLVWRSMGRQFVPCPPHQLVRLATTLYDLAPRLLAHDLMKVCAIEALLAAKASDAARSIEAHA